MKPDGPIKLVAELLDLPLLDADGKYCGVVDDVEFAGAARKPLKLKALLVGPGAYAGRMPGWAMGLVKAVAGDRLTRVPMARVKTIGTTVQLDCAASVLGLDASDAAAARWLPRRGAL
jgi:sporulation protein YlmC with PRC-barrel domain